MLQNCTPRHCRRFDNMDRFLNRNLSFLHCKSKCSLLAFAWISGLLLGAYFSLSADTILSSTMLAAPFGSLSISGLLTVLLLPLFLSALAVYFSQPILLISVVFLKAFLYTYTGIGLLLTYHSAGWILRFLLMFSDTLMLPILWLIWLRAAPWDRRALYRYGVVCTIFAFLIGCIDYAYVVPFLAHLILT